MMNPDMLQADRFGPDSPGLKTDETVHDLKNLLVGMRLLVELALEELPGESPLRNIIEQIPSACQEAQELVETLGSGGGRAVAPSRHGCFDISALVDSASFLLGASVPKGVKLEFELSANQGMIRVNPIQFRQVLMNLVVNALQALDGRQGTVVVRTGSTNLGQYRCGSIHADYVRPGHYHTLEVSDTGCGMDEATRASALEPLFTTKLNGQGLGLASVRRIVTENRGAIQLRSSPGVGTSVCVLFPDSERSESCFGRSELCLQ